MQTRLPNHHSVFSRGACLRLCRGGIHLIAVAIVFSAAVPALADFATSGGLRQQRTRSIFHPGSSRQANPGMADPFLDQPSQVAEPVSTPASQPHAAQAPPSPPNAQAGSPAANRQNDGWIHPSVVRVRSVEEDSVANGSGTLIGVDEKHGYVITNWHVIEGAQGQVSVEFPDGFQSAATVMKSDEEWDLAVLVIWKPKAHPMALSPKLPTPGEQLIIAGYGQGAFRSALGKMTSLVAPEENAPLEMFEVSTAARQGDSGGPIVNMQGQLAGVLFGAGDGRTTGSHVGRLKKFLDEAFAQPGGAVAQRAEVAPVPQEAMQPAPQAPAVAAAPRGDAQQPAAFHQSPDVAAEQAVQEAEQSIANSLPMEPMVPESVPSEFTPLPAGIEPVASVQQPPAPSEVIPGAAPLASVAMADLPVAPVVARGLPGAVPDALANALPAGPGALSSSLPSALPGALPTSLPPDAAVARLASAQPMVNVTHVEDELAGIPFAGPLDYGSVAAFNGHASHSPVGAVGSVGQAHPQVRGGNAFGDLKTFFAVFGLFAVVFVLLPR